MSQVTVDTVIAAPPEEVFDFVSDLSRRPAYADHYLKEYRLARANPVGKGAAARFVLDPPLFNEHAETEIVEAERPGKIVEEGRVGRRGRSRFAALYEFEPEDGKTRVRLTTYSEPKTPIDRLRHTGVQGWLKRQSGKSLERLRRIFEEPSPEDLERATVAGYEPHKAPRFGAHVPVTGKPGSAG
jgi:uncharacterized protein YndB with AHSA1/START domain